MSAPTLVEHRLGPLEQIPLGEGREFRVGGVAIAVFRPRSGALAATAAECPHRGGPLADGIIGLGTVMCPLHNRRYSLTTGEDTAGGPPAACHPVRIDAGEIVVALRG